MKSIGRRRVFLSSVLGVMVMLSACRQPVTIPAENGETPGSETLQKELEEANRALNEREEKIINQYVSRHELKLTVSPTGLRYKIYKPGKGDPAIPGDLVKFNYTVGLINGISIESSDEAGASELLLEKGEAISGLHELLGKMNKGSKARAIIPSHLAYGFSGEQGRIPKGATLIYDIEVLEIISPLRKVNHSPRTENQHFPDPKGRLIFSSLPFRAREKRTENQTDWVFGVDSIIKSESF